MNESGRAEYKSYISDRSENYLRIESNELTAAAIKTTTGNFIWTETQKL